MISQIVISSIILFLVYKLLIRSYSFLDCAVFGTAFGAIAVNIGIRVTLFEIFSFLALVHTITYLIAGKYKYNTRLNPVCLYLAYTVFSTVIISLFFIEEFIKVKHGNYLREEGRFITQIIKQVLFNFSFVIAAAMSIKSKKMALKLLKVFITASVIAALLGSLQFLIHYLTGTDIFPIIRPEGLEQSAEFYLTKGTNLLRLTALSGEPKGFANHSIVAILLLLLSIKFKAKIVENEKLKAVLLISTTFLTLSTGGFVLLPLLLFLIFMIDLIRLRFYSFFSVFKFASLLILIVFITYPIWNFVSLIIEMRVLSRTDLATEDFNYIILSFLINSPEWLWFGSGMGNIHNLAYPYIPRELLFYIKDTIFVAKNGYLKIISESGFVGFILFLIAPSIIILKLWTKSNIFYKILTYLIIIILVLFMATSYIYFEFLIILGIGLASVKQNFQKVEVI